MYGDLLMKYDGWSIFSQVSWRDADPPTNRPNRSPLYEINEGTALLVQTGYMVSEVTEISGRYSTYQPSNAVEPYFSGEDQYTVGVTRFVRADRLKLQADVTWVDLPSDASMADHLMIRGQVQVDF
jgi:hypothetical protein